MDNAERQARNKKLFEEWAVKCQWGTEIDDGVFVDASKVIAIYPKSGGSIMTTVVFESGAEVVAQASVDAVREILRQAWIKKCRNLQTIDGTLPQE